MTSPLFGVMVGGRSSRMGSPKGLLRHPTEAITLVERAVQLARTLDLDVVLVGDATPYRALMPDVAALDDAPAGVGPLGGLRALMLRAGPRPVVALACDMPFVTRETLRRLVEHPSTAPALCPRRGVDAPWEPLCARYDAALALPAADATLAAHERALQRWLARLPVEVFDVDPAELDDWDAPGDVIGPAKSTR